MSNERPYGDDREAREAAREAESREAARQLRALTRAQWRSVVEADLLPDPKPAGPSLLERLKATLRSAVVIEHGESSESSPAAKGRSSLLAAALVSALAVTGPILTVMGERAVMEPLRAFSELLQAKEAQPAAAVQAPQSLARPALASDPADLASSRERVTRVAQGMLGGISSHLALAEAAGGTPDGSAAWTKALAALEPALLSDNPKDRQTASVLLRLAPELLEAAGAARSQQTWMDEFRDDMQPRMAHLTAETRRAVERVEEGRFAGAADRLDRSFRSDATGIERSVEAFMRSNAPAVGAVLREFAAMEYLDQLVRAGNLATITDRALAGLLDAQSAGPRAADFYREFPVVREAGLAESLRLHYQVQHDALRHLSRNEPASGDLSAVRKAALDVFETDLARLGPQAFALMSTKDTLSPYDRGYHQDELERFRSEMLAQPASGFSFTGEIIAGPTSSAGQEQPAVMAVSDLEPR